MDGLGKNQCKKCEEFTFLLELVSPLCGRTAMQHLRLCLGAERTSEFAVFQDLADHLPRRSHAVGDLLVVELRFDHAPTLVHGEFSVFARQRRPE